MTTIFLKCLQFRQGFYEILSSEKFLNLNMISFEAVLASIKKLTSV